MESGLGHIISKILTQSTHALCGWRSTLIEAKGRGEREHGMKIYGVETGKEDIIWNINESNDYSDPSVKRRKISELCTDTRYELLIDEIEIGYKKQNAKIIELPNTRKSNK